MSKPKLIEIVHKHIILGLRATKTEIMMLVQSQEQRDLWEMME